MVYPVTVTRERLAEHLRQVLTEAQWFRGHFQGSVGVTIKDHDDRLAEAEAVLAEYDRERGSA